MCEYNADINCTCTYPCPNHAKCCDCLAHHLKSGEFPACFFSAAAEKAGHRSFEELIRDRQG